jgi:hypothetical protein
MCSKGITKPFENLKYVKPPNEGIASFVSRVFSTMGGITKANTFHAHKGGPRSNNRASIKQFDLLVLMVYLSNVD